VTINTVGDNQFLVLKCINETSEDSANVVITVTATPTEPPAGDCGSYQSPLGDGNVVEWNTFWREEFPFPLSNRLDANIPRNSYLALKFDTGSITRAEGESGAFDTVESTATSGRRLGSVSRCPGDFDVAEECRASWGYDGLLIWSTNGRANACQLDDDTVYYFNLTFTDGTNPASTECQDSLCQTMLFHYKARN
jgi:hypothetical protein